MKKRGLYILLAFMSLFIFNGSANAACKDYGNSGKDACLAQAEDGFKCEYNASRKGVARCYKGDTAADEIIVEPSTSEDNNTNDNSTAEDNEPCNRYASQGENYCKSQSYNGYKCAWDINKKGGARCYQSNYLTDEKKNELTSTVNSCSDIKDASVCNNSKVKGVQCFYTHHVCANKTDSDGSNSTVIGDGSTDNSNSSNSSSSSSSSSNNNQTSETDSEYYTGCPLGEDVTKDLYGILKIVKIVAPLLVIALTILDLVRALAKGDIQGESKKLVNHFIRRSILAVILFFLPVLINQAMILADIWDENGTCDFSNSVTIKENNKNSNEDNKDKCSSRSANQRYCENKSGCKWNSVTNTCGEATTTDYRKENCDGYYDATSDECVKKSNITCATFSGEKAKCKNLSKSYGLTCSFNEVSFECSEDTSTTIEPSNGNNNNNNNNNNNTVVSDISKFPKDSLNCWQHGYDTCSGVCKWSGENAGTGGCRSASEVSESIVKDVCSLATDRDQCTSLDSYCYWTTYSCAPYSE